MHLDEKIAILAVSSCRLFAKNMRSKLSSVRDLDIISFANTKSLALASALQCSVALVDASVFSTREVNEIARSLRCQSNDIKVIAVFVEPTLRTMLNHIEAGIVGFISATDSDDTLIQTIRGVYAGKAFIGEDVIAHVMTRLGELRACNAHTLRGHDCMANMSAYTLSQRESQVFNLVGQGLSNRQIADQLIIEYGTVKNHVHKILKKLGVVNRQEAANLHELITTRPHAAPVAAY